MCGRDLLLKGMYVHNHMRYDLEACGFIQEPCVYVLLYYSTNDKVGFFWETLFLGKYPTTMSA